MNLKQFFRSLNYWNRKLHIQIGLFLLLFLWLFSFSGLLMNHRNWNASDFWNKREENKAVIPVQIPKSRESELVINKILSQVGAEGEISNIKMWADSIHFTVSIPGYIKIMKVDFETSLCTQKELKYNWSGIIQTLHTFNGTEKGNADSLPDWLLTRVWRISMDGIAIGLILLCVSSWIMWFRKRHNFTHGWIFLSGGFLCVAYFVFILKVI